MNPDSLRSEFIITGTGALGALIGLGGALGWMDWQAIYRIIFTDLSSGLAALILATYLAVSFVTGIAVVQMTFYFPTKRMIEKVRETRWDDLIDLDSSMRAAGRKPPVSTQNQFLEMVFSNSTDRAPKTACLRSIALTLSRSTTTDELSDEYRYRRSNRRIFVGMIPTAVIASLALTVWLAGNNRWGWLIAPPIAGVGLTYGLYAAALYQERIGQSLLIDAVFLLRWTGSVGK